MGFYIKFHPNYQLNEKVKTTNNGSLTKSVNYKTIYYNTIICISKNSVVYYCKCCNLIGYATRYLFVNRYRVSANNATRPSFSKKKQ